jgi:hypothetical protein
MKLCKYCKIEQPEENFGIAAIINGKTYRRHKCRACKQARQRERRQEVWARLAEYKKTLSCVRCGFADYRALDFHHLDPGEKDVAVADFVSRGASSAKIKKEIEKCVVLCANCHRIEHYGNGM